MATNCSSVNNMISSFHITFGVNRRMGYSTARRSQHRIQSYELVSDTDFTNFEGSLLTVKDVYPERGRVMATVHAVCRCDPESGCGDNCINRIMSYLCGRDCPCGENCTNKSLVKRKTPSVKLTYVRPCGSKESSLTSQDRVSWLWPVCSTRYQ